MTTTTHHWSSCPFPPCRHRQVGGWGKGCCVWGCHRTQQQAGRFLRRRRQQHLQRFPTTAVSLEAAEKTRASPGIVRTWVSEAGRGARSLHPRCCYCCYRC
ncbi:unnamed protein product [Ectocarpus sp. 8 AP-2014]